MAKSDEKGDMSTRRTAIVAIDIVNYTSYYSKYSIQKQQAICGISESDNDECTEEQQLFESFKALLFFITALALVLWPWLCRYKTGTFLFLLWGFSVILIVSFAMAAVLFGAAWVVSVAVGEAWRRLNPVGDETSESDFLKAVAEAIAAPLKAESANSNPLVVSIAAGIRIGDLSRWLGYNTIVRIMPNTPALVSEGASGIYASPSVSEKQKDLAFAMCASFSKLAYWLDKEQLLDVVTGTSGSGPAYFLYLCEAMVEVAVEQGMPREIARGLVAQTCLGIGKMSLSQLDTEFSILRRNVMSPKGTTEAGVKVFDDNNAKQYMKDRVVAATKRADGLGDILESQVIYVYVCK
ncbi:hypothetical protein HK100_001937 [Physocladia obscura]|uniref:Pyrroline-5-carboxylate reductase dimerisation domain-containing protein n=1 Tax=Physocladia obscura TaxID=109957 RepID=A0AAD5XBG2_9FUNG|nr:hypothetical protein HK100_001937 [Physocladia obscura]